MIFNIYRYCHSEDRPRCLLPVHQKAALATSRGIMIEKEMALI
jgi:hypothetical protein